MNKKILIAGVIALAVLASSMAIISEVDDGSVSADTADTYVAKIGDAKYQTLQSAFQAVESGQTIELLTDCTGGGLFLGAGSKTITLDFNGYTYTATAPSVGSPGTQTQAFHFEKGNTVTLKDGTLKLSNESTLKMGIQNYCTLTLNNFDVDASGDTYCSYAISNNFGSLTVTGGSDITAYSGKVAFDVYYWPNNSYAEGVTVTFDSDYTGTVSGKIEYGSDGTSTGKADVATKAKLVINAGTFISSFTVCNLNDNGDTGITINGGSFTDLVDAVRYAASGITIKLADDATGPGIGLFNTERGQYKIAAKSLTIDLGGHTYTVIGPAVGSGDKYLTQGFHLETGCGDFTLKNGTITSLSGSGVMMLVQNYCTLTLDDVILDGSNIGNGQYVLSNNCGVVSITGTTSITAPTDGFAFDACSTNQEVYSAGTQVTVDTTGTITGKVEFGIWGNVPNPVNTSLTINNGIFIGDLIVDPRLSDAAETKIIINGGSFTDLVDAVRYAASGITIKLADDATGPGIGLFNTE
ncbi:MAG: hypothetical protein M0P29_14240, partial [Sphaerochaetaceae bacterium]|nr:hypothetical protein [Sphaerochaetaceae bacterium]